MVICDPTGAFIETVARTTFVIGPGVLNKDKTGNEAILMTSTSANSSPALGGKKKVYNSVAQMKRSKKGGVDLNNLHKDYHSTPDLQTKSTENGHHDALDHDPSQINRQEPRRIHSQEDLHLLHLSNKEPSPSTHPEGYFTLPHKKSTPTVEDEHRTITRIRPIQTRSHSVGSSRLSSTDDSPSSAGPAPSHPPPPPPMGMMMTVSRNNSSSDYAKVGVSHEAPVSSFNPSSSARLYESPKEVSNIGYKAPNNKANEVKKKSPTRTHSLPPRPTRPMVLKRIEVSQNERSFASSIYISNRCIF